MNKALEKQYNILKEINTNLMKYERYGYTDLSDYEIFSEPKVGGKKLRLEWDSKRYEKTGKWRLAMTVANARLIKNTPYATLSLTKQIKAHSYKQNLDNLRQIYKMLSNDPEVRKEFTNGTMFLPNGETIRLGLKRPSPKILKAIKSFNEMIHKHILENALAIYLHEDLTEAVHRPWNEKLTWSEVRRILKIKVGETEELEDEEVKTPFDE